MPWPRFRRSAALACLATLGALTAQPGQAQVIVAPPPFPGANQNPIVNGQDVAPRHLSIRVGITTAALADVNQLGLNFSHIPLSEQLAPGQGANNTSTQSVMRFAYGNVAAQLEALLTEMRTGRLSTVFLQAIDGEPNLLNANAIQRLPPGNAPAMGTFFVDRGVRITPHINADGTVTLNLTSPGEAKDFASGDTSAALKTMTMRCTIRNGESVAFFDTADASEHFYRLGEQKSPLRLIFITPTIVGNGSTAGPR